MGTGMKSLKWEGIGTKNMFPHTSSAHILEKRSWVVCRTGFGKHKVRSYFLGYFQPPNLQNRPQDQSCGRTIAALRE